VTSLAFRPSPPAPAPGRGPQRQPNRKHRDPDQRRVRGGHPDRGRPRRL